jgi:polar amino acid transport system substrate-binding protein
MKMKRIIALIAAATMVFSMAACGSSDSAATDGVDTDTQVSVAEETDESEDADAVESTDGDTLVMATNATFPPYEYQEGDEIVGIDVEIAQAIADDLGKELVIDDIDFDSIVTSVQSGKADMGIAGMTVSEERLKNVNFSDSYATGVQVIIVPEDSDITGPDDLEGKYIGVQQGTTGHLYCSDDYGDDYVIAYQNGTSAVEALKTGKVDCVVIDNEPAKAFVAANEGLKILNTEYVVEDYAIAIAKDNDELLEQVNATLARLKEDGTLQAIIDKYITAE